MQPKRLAFGLGIFSIALGVVELVAAKRIAATMDAPDHAGLVRGFGAREVLAGVNLIVAPAASVNMWNRVAGDALDLGTLALAAKRSPSNRAIWARSRSSPGSLWSTPLPRGDSMARPAVSFRSDRRAGRTRPRKFSCRWSELRRARLSCPNQYGEPP